MVQISILDGDYTVTHVRRLVASDVTVALGLN